MAPRSFFRATRLRHFFCYLYQPKAHRAMFASHKYLAYGLVMALVGLCGSTMAQEPSADPLAALSPYDRMLIQYADSNNADAVLQCLYHGANPNAATADGITALMCAVQNGNYFIVSSLLNSGANPQMAPHDGTTALHAAAIMGHDSIAFLLLNAGAAVDVANALGLTPLHYSAWHGYPYLTELLLLNGAPPDAIDSRRNTPLMLAVYNGAAQCAMALLRHGASPNRSDYYGLTPAMVAAQLDDTLMLHLLLRSGADVTPTDNRGFDVLAHAIARNAEGAVQLLLPLIQGRAALAPTYHALGQGSSPIIKRTLDSSIPKAWRSVGIGAVALGIELNAARHAWHWGMSVGLVERITNVELHLRYMRRLSGAVLVERDRQLYQVDETRRLLGLELGQRWVLNANVNRALGMYYGVGADVAFRRFDGLASPSPSPSLSARAGLFCRHGVVEWRLGWTYTGLSTPKVTGHMFGVGLQMLLPTGGQNAYKKRINYVE